MPERTLRKIMAATDTADVAQMAVIECLRQIADASKGTNEVLKGMQSELKDVRERVIRIEASEFKAEVTAAKLEIEKTRVTTSADIQALEHRVDLLEADKNRRDGALSLVEWICRNWPAIIGFVALIVVVVLANNGRFHL